MSVQITNNINTSQSFLIKFNASLGEELIFPEYS